MIVEFLMPALSKQGSCLKQRRRKKTHEMKETNENNFIIIVCYLYTIMAKERLLLSR